MTRSALMAWMMEFKEVSESDINHEWGQEAKEPLQSLVNLGLVGFYGHASRNYYVNRRNI